MKPWENPSWIGTNFCVKVFEFQQINSSWLLCPDARKTVGKKIEVESLTLGWGVTLKKGPNNLLLNHYFCWKTESFVNYELLNSKIRLGAQNLKSMNSKPKFNNSKLKFVSSKPKFVSSKLKFVSSKLKFVSSKLKFVSSKLIFSYLKLRLET